MLSQDMAWPMGSENGSRKSDADPNPNRCVLNITVATRPPEMPKKGRRREKGRFVLLGRAGRPAEFCKHTPVERQGGPKSGASIAYYPSVPDCRVLLASGSLPIWSWGAERKEFGHDARLEMAA